MTEPNGERWTRMEIEGNGDHTVISSNIWGYLPSFHLPNPFHSVKRWVGLLVVVATGVLLSIAIAGANQADMDLEGTKSQRPLELRSLLSGTRSKAQALGKLNPLSTVSSIYTHDNINYLLFQANYTSTEIKDKLPTLGPESSTTPDPFSPKTRDPSLLVAPIPPFHSLLLNKYFTLRDHALLVTDINTPQWSLLTYEDLDAWFFCLAQIRAVGFYNSAYEAGASQTHKHVQLVPLDEIRRLRGGSGPALPVEDVLLQVMASHDVYDPYNGRETFSIRQYPFKHAIARLLTPSEWTSATSSSKSSPSYARYLFTAYVDLLRETGILADRASLGQRRLGEEALQPYNIIFTEAWIMAVPRSQRMFEDTIDVNGLGFAGLLLARDDDALKLIKSVTPAIVLQGVAQPR